MLNKNIESLLNDQLNREFMSALFYLNLASKAEILGYKGVAHWFKVQYHEENFHAMKIYDYILTRGAAVHLKDISIPTISANSVEDLFNETLIHEKEVTDYINSIMDSVLAMKDHASQAFMQWYVLEQVEEEANVEEILQKINILKENNLGVLTLDSELGNRSLTVPLDFTQKLPPI